MSQSVPPPLPPPAPVPVQTLAYTMGRGGRPGIVTAMGVMAIVVACLSGVASFFACVYGAMFFAFMPMWSAAAAGGAASATASASAPPAAVQPLPMGEVSVAVNTLQSVLQLDGRRVRELDNLLRTHGREVLGTPGAGEDADDQTPGPVTDAWLRESIKSPQPAAGPEAEASFTTAQGKVEIFPDRTVFTSTDGTHTIRTSAAHQSESESSPGTETQVVTHTAASGRVAPPAGTTLTKTQVRSVMKAVKGAAAKPLTSAQLKAIEQQISVPNQDIVTPGSARPVAGVTQSAQGVVVTFDGGVLNIGNQGQVLGTFSTSSLVPKIALIRPPLALLVIESALSLALAVYLLVAGILVFRSSFGSPRLLWIYALIKIPLAVVGAVAMAWLVHRLSFLTTVTGGASPTLSIRTAAGVAIAFLFSAAFPVGVLVCLRTSTVRAFFNSVSK